MIVNPIWLNKGTISLKYSYGIDILKQLANFILSIQVPIILLY